MFAFLPSQKTTADLNAAASVSAGLGKLTNNRAQIQVADVDSLSPDDHKNSNLLLIGQLGENKLIDR